MTYPPTPYIPLPISPLPPPTEQQQQEEEHRSLWQRFLVDPFVFAGKKVLQGLDVAGRAWNALVLDLAVNFAYDIDQPTSILDLFRPSRGILGLWTGSEAPIKREPAKLRIPLFSELATEMARAYLSAFYGRDGLRELRKAVVKMKSGEMTYGELKAVYDRLYERLPIWKAILADPLTYAFLPGDIALIKSVAEKGVKAAAASPRLASSLPKALRWRHAYRLLPAFAGAADEPVVVEPITFERLIGASQPVRRTLSLADEPLVSPPEEYLSALRQLGRQAFKEATDTKLDRSVRAAALQDLEGLAAASIASIYQLRNTEISALRWDNIITRQTRELARRRLPWDEMSINVTVPHPGGARSFTVTRPAIAGGVPIAQTVNELLDYVKQARASLLKETVAKSEFVFPNWSRPSKPLAGTAISDRVKQATQRLAAHFSETARQQVFGTEGRVITSPASLDVLYEAAQDLPRISPSVYGKRGQIVSDAVRKAIETKNLRTLDGERLIYAFRELPKDEALKAAKGLEDKLRDAYVRAVEGMWDEVGGAHHRKLSIDYIVRKAMDSNYDLDYLVRSIFRHASTDATASYLRVGGAALERRIKELTEIVAKVGGRTIANLEKELEQVRTSLAARIGLGETTYTRLKGGVAPRELERTVRYIRAGQEIAERILQPDEEVVKLTAKVLGEDAHLAGLASSAVEEVGRIVREIQATRMFLKKGAKGITSEGRQLLRSGMKDVRLVAVALAKWVDDALPRIVARLPADAPPSVSQKIVSLEGLLRGYLIADPDIARSVGIVVGRRFMRRTVKGYKALAKVLGANIGRIWEKGDNEAYETLLKHGWAFLGLEEVGPDRYVLTKTWSALARDIRRRATSLPEVFLTPNELALPREQMQERLAERVNAVLSRLVNDRRIAAKAAKEPATEALLSAVVEEASPVASVSELTSALDVEGLARTGVLPNRTLLNLRSRVEQSWLQRHTYIREALRVAGVALPVIGPKRSAWAKPAERLVYAFEHIVHNVVPQMAGRIINDLRLKYSKVWYSIDELGIIRLDGFAWTGRYVEDVEKAAPHLLTKEINKQALDQLRNLTSNALKTVRVSPEEIYLHHDTVLRMTPDLIDFFYTGPQVRLVQNAAVALQQAYARLIKEALQVSPSVQGWWNRMEKQGKLFFPYVHRSVSAERENISLGYRLHIFRAPAWFRERVLDDAARATRLGYIVRHPLLALGEFIYDWSLVIAQDNLLAALGKLKQEIGEFTPLVPVGAKGEVVSLRVNPRLIYFHTKALEALLKGLRTLREGMAERLLLTVKERDLIEKHFPLIWERARTHPEELETIIREVEGVTEQWQRARQQWVELHSLQKDLAYAIGNDPEQMKAIVRHLASQERAIRLPGLLRGAYTAAMGLRIFQSGLDIGTMFLHMLIGLAARPRDWSAAVWKGIRSWFDEEWWFNYVAGQTQDWADAVKYGINPVTGSIQEQVLGLPVAMPSVLQRVPTAKRFERLYSTMLTEMRLRLWKAFLPMVEERFGRSPAAKNALARIILNSTGGYSPYLSGALVSERMWEGLLLSYAPVFRRGLTMFLLRMLDPREAKAWLPGKMGRTVEGSVAAKMGRNLLGALAAWGAMVYLTGNNKDVFDPSRPGFMAVRVGNLYLGPGTAVISLLRGLGRIGRAAAGLNDTSDRFADVLASILWTWRSQAPLLPQLAFDLLEGKTFIGFPLRNLDGGLDAARTAAHLTGTLLPFWIRTAIEDTLMQDEGVAVGAADSLANFLGLRSFPVSRYQMFQDLARHYIENDADVAYLISQLPEDLGDNIGYYDLPRHIRNLLLERHPDLDELRIKSLEESAMTGRGRRALISRLVLDMETARRKRNEMWQQAVEGFRQTGDGPRFRSRLHDISRWYSGVLEGLLQNDQNAAAYSEMLARRDKRWREGKIYLAEFLADQMMVALTSGLFEDEFGDFDWGAWRNYEASIRRVVDEDVWQLVETIRRSARDVPPEIREYWQAVEALRPYWDAYKQVVAPGSLDEYVYVAWRNMRSSALKSIYVSLHPELRNIIKRVEDIRLEMRKTNPVIDYYLTKYYGYTPAFPTPLLTPLTPALQ